MEIFDVSVPLRTGMVVYPGDPEVRLERWSSISEGAVANLSRLDFGVHSGTHVDAPLHFIDGAAGAEKLPLAVLVGPCVVVATEGLSLDDVAPFPKARSGCCSRRRTRSSGHRTSSRRSSRA